MSDLAADLRSALIRTRELVGASADSPWSSTPREQIDQTLEAAIRSIESGQSPHASSLALLFAPTGPLQEISLDNRWGDELNGLAETIDFYLARR